MSFSAKPRWKSWDQAAKNLDELVSKVERQGKREAVRKASRPMLKAVKQKVKEKTGTLKRSLKVKVSTFKKGGVIVATIGPDRKTKGVDEKGNVIDPVKYAHLQEFGSVHNPASPYMRPAFDGTKQESIRVYAAEIGPAIQRVGKRIGKKVAI